MYSVLPVTGVSLSIKSKVGMATLLQINLNDIQHHGKLAEEQYTVALKNDSLL